MPGRVMTAAVLRVLTEAVWSGPGPDAGPFQVIWVWTLQGTHVLFLLAVLLLLF